MPQPSTAPPPAPNTHPRAACTPSSTPARRRPEIREGWASYEAKVDLFSLGVMAFELW